MGVVYKIYSGTWRDDGPMDVIAENNFGLHPIDIYFPNVRSCTALVARMPLGLCGIHLTAVDDETVVEEMLSKMAAKTGGRASELFFVGRLSELGNGCPPNSPYRGASFYDAAKQRLAGGGGKVWKAAIGSDSDLRAALGDGKVTVSRRPISHPVTAGGGWEKMLLNTV